MKKNKLILIITILFLKTITLTSQTKVNEEVIKNFIKSVFIENKPAKFIADNYMYFGPIDNSKYTIDDRLKILNKHLKKIKKEKRSSIDLKKLSIVSYAEYKEQKILFEKSTENIFIATNKNIPVMYFYISNNKILSFDYIMKGDDGYFITY